MSFADEIEKLNKLKESGTLSEEEYEKAKASLLRQAESTGEKLSRAVSGLAADVNLWSMFIHLTQFCGYIVPLAGMVVPIVLWQVKKNESPIIDQHGRIVTNWIISGLIYLIVSGLLSFIVIGIPLLLILAILGVVFPIVGGLKANSGTVWEYPLSIRFFPVNPPAPQNPGN